MTTLLMPAVLAFEPNVTVLAPVSPSVSMLVAWRKSVSVSVAAAVIWMVSLPSRRWSPPRQDWPLC